MAFRELFYLAATLVTKGIAGDEKQKANQRAYGVPDPCDFNLQKPTQVLDAAQIRALATGGILFYNGDQPITGLFRLTRIGMARNRASLTEWWGISSTEEALDTLTWLQKQGHRQEFKAKLRKQPTYWQQEFADKKFVIYSIDLNVGAWDYARLVNVARWCYDCQYLSWEQAWPFIAQANALALREYDSWESFANGFMAGRLMWQPGSPTHEYIGEATQALLTAPDGIWLRYPWRPAAAQGQPS